MNPVVSVYIPTRNRLGLLKRAVYSVLSQTYRNIELIVVIDGSADESEMFLQSIQSDIPIRIIINKKPQGACTARNRAIESARGEFVTGLDDDDWFRPDRIDYFVKKWNELSQEGKKYAGLCDATFGISEKSIITWNWSPSIGVREIRLTNAVGSQIFAKRQIYIDAGLFDPNLPAWQDWDLWLRIIEMFGEVLNIQVGTYFFDQSHTEPRISTAHSSSIRRAYEIFRDKHKNNSLVEKTALLLAYSRYPQATLQFKDLLTLIMTFRLQTAIKLIYDGKVRWINTST